MTEEINFFTENLNYRIPQKKKLRNWIRKIVEKENFTLGNINIIICDDTFLGNLNKIYLKKDTLTDIITFSFNENTKQIDGDLYISKFRVKENAKKYNTNILNELSRVIIHGILHLIGYGDENEIEKSKMRFKEDECLGILKKEKNSK